MRQANDRVHLDHRSRLIRSRRLLGQRGAQKVSMNTNEITRACEADVARHNAWQAAIAEIDAGELQLPNAVCRLRTQYSRAFREYELDAWLRYKAMLAKKKSGK